MPNRRCFPAPTRMSDLAEVLRCASLALALLVGCNGNQGAASSQSAAKSGAPKPTPASSSAAAAASAPKRESVPAPSGSGAAAPSGSPAPSSGAWVAVEGAEIDANDLNDGVHHFTVEPFSMDAREVSVADYRACVTAGACKPPPDNPLQAGRCNYPHADLDRASLLSKNVSQALVPETVGFRCIKPSSDKPPGLLP